MKTILCYGDSNTYGYDPSNGLRYPKNQRWTTLLEEKLKETYDLIPEGLNGRTTDSDWENEDVKNGMRHLDTILRSHRPLDIVVFMLGTNDCKFELHKDAKKITEGMEKLVVRTKELLNSKQGYAPEIVVVCPPHIREEVLQGPFAFEFSKDSLKTCDGLFEEYKALCDRHGCIFADASAADISPADGLHLSVRGHEDIAELLYRCISSLASF
ncbi:MAG: hypothetical protein IKF68_00340 [Erysipelotrichaceae bacterium]|nr:hypothetical protein [Erysipelotrichaceae bacterium]